MHKKMVATLFGTLVTASLAPQAQAGEKHLVYMQGCCVKSASNAMAKDYEAIVQKLRDSGFNVFFELRTADATDGNEQAQAYAAKIAEHVKGLIDKGTAPQDITVSGFSLGSSTTLVAASLIANPKVNYVLLAGCPVNASIRVDIDYSKVTGRVLSITDKGDDKFGSCAGRLPNSSAFQEIVLDSGEGHKLFRLNDDGKMKLWKEPLENWAKGV